MNNKSKSWALMLIVALAVSLVAGCSGSNGGANSTNQGSSETDSADANTGNEVGGNEGNAQGEKAYLISEKPLELTIHMLIADIRFNDDYEVFKKVAELTNISLKGTVPSAATKGEEAFNLMIASNDIPDIVHYDKSKFDTFGPEGAFLPLDDLIEQHAPNIKKFYEENPEVKKATLSPDGKQYTITFIPDGSAAEGWFIRQDWLGKLGLEQPKTVDELYTVLKAFKEKDPNENGKADEIPFFHRRLEPEGIYDLMPYWGMNFKAIGEPFFFLNPENRKAKEYVFAPLLPEFKTAITELAKWYQEGLIDPEIFTRGGKARDMLLADNIGGMTHDWFGSTAGYNDTLKEQISGFDFAPILPPADVNGKVKEISRNQPFNGLGWGIGSSTKHAVEAIKYFDFWFTEQGIRMNNAGIEGKTYEVVDGKAQYTQEFLDRGNVIAELRELGAKQSIGGPQEYEFDKQWMNPIALEGVNLYEQAGVYESVELPSTFTEEEKEQLNKLYEPIRTYLKETLQKWILGGEPIEGNFEKFQERLKEMGIEEVLEIRKAERTRTLGLNE